MSHIVMLGAPAHGHVNPTLPIVRELVEQGERVTYFDDALFRPAIEAAGAAFCPYPASQMGARELAAALRDGNMAGLAPMIMGATRTLLPHLLEQLPAEKPDILIFDSIALWGRMAATSLRLPSVASITHFILGDDLIMSSGEHGLRYLRQLLPKLPALLIARLRLSRRYPALFPRGGPLIPVRGDLTLVYTSRELQPDTPIIDASFRFVGPSLAPRVPSGVPPLDLPSGCTLIYISLGTIHTGQVDFYQRCFEAFRDHPAHFVLSVGDESVSRALDGVPANFTVRATVPQLELLPHVALFVTHGGMNSLSEALYYGVPLVVAPRQFEQLLNGRIVARQGAALMLDDAARGRPVTAEGLREAVERVLSEPGYRESAARVQATLRAAGGFRRAADEIQALIKQAG